MHFVFRMIGGAVESDFETIANYRVTGLEKVTAAILRCRRSRPGSNDVIDKWIVVEFLNFMAQPMYIPNEGFRIARVRGKDSRIAVRGEDVRLHCLPAIAQKRRGRTVVSENAAVIRVVACVKERVVKQNDRYRSWTDVQRPDGLTESVAKPVVVQQPDVRV